ncbi:MAG: hypothetical protein M1817_000002 [Caeruleum heppii]|nr:MAG: hypothetical protein M1817_000002 [Caeruleum heppii]
MTSRLNRTLVLTLDAFGTLFTPKEPIARQYLHQAVKLGFAPVEEEELQTSFKRAFKYHSSRHPNYGKASGMDASVWWANIIQDTFSPFSSPSNPIPDSLVPDLLKRFSSDEGYRLYDDVLPLLKSIHKSNNPNEPISSRSWPWHQTIVGVTTNSDHRVPSILSSLGLDISNCLESESPVDSPDLDSDIQFTILSYDVGAEKPGPRIFNAAKEMSSPCFKHGNGLAAAYPHSGNAASSEDKTYLHVGDDLDKDVVGAQQAGWNSVLIDRKGQHAAHSGDPMAVISVPFPKSSQSGRLASYQVIKDLRALVNWHR